MTDRGKEGEYVDEEKTMKQSLNGHSINPKISLFFAFFVTAESCKGRGTGHWSLFLKGMNEPCYIWLCINLFQQKKNTFSCSYLVTAFARIPMLLSLGGIEECPAEVCTLSCTIM